jgi:oligoribonuclease NrnB/cAMP/cGMP phosphodiesterase (DHH superfamily)
MSAAIVREWYRATNQKMPIHFIGWDYGDPTPMYVDKTECVVYKKKGQPPYFIRSTDLVYILDISFPVKAMTELFNNVGELTWIDHHKSAIETMVEFEEDHIINGIRDTKFAACELTWQYLFPEEEVPTIVHYLGRYDCFGHKGTGEEQRVLEFQYAARMKMRNMDDCYHYVFYEKNHNVAMVSRMLNDGEAIYKYLCTDAQNALKLSFERKFEGKKFLCFNKERFNPKNFNISQEEYDGFICFWFNPTSGWNFSIYSDTIDCSEVAVKCGGGGHKGAAGWIYDFDKEQIFKQFLWGLY